VQWLQYRPVSIGMPQLSQAGVVLMMYSLGCVGAVATVESQVHGAEELSELPGVVCIAAHKPRLVARLSIVNPDGLPDGMGPGATRNTRDLPDPSPKNHPRCDPHSRPPNAGQGKPVVTRSVFAEHGSHRARNSTMCAAR
jgi:hypothetical protein